MSNLNDARVTIAGKLAAAGAPATLDPASTPPCVLVGAPTITPGAGIGGWTVDVPILPLHTQPGDGVALVWLLDQVELVLITFPGATAVPTTYDPAGKDLPAYEITVTVPVTNPTC